jgi:hypothetical protein
MPSKTSRRSERRRAPRVDAKLSMRVEGVPDDGQAAQIVTESQNISASGVYCTSSHFLSPLSKVALTIVLPRIPGAGGRQELVKCEGIVVRCEPVSKRGDRRFELACMFSELDLKRRELINQFVTWRNLQALRAAAAPRPRARAAATTGAATRKAAAARSRRVPAKKKAVRKTAVRRRAVN